MTDQVATPRASQTLAASARPEPGPIMTATFQYLGTKREPTSKSEMGNPLGWEHFAYKVTLTHKGRAWPGIDYRTGTGWVTVKPDHSRRGGDRPIGDVRLNYFGPGKDGYAVRREPTAANVLESLLSDARLWIDAVDFKDFCANLGYDADSKKAQGIYDACGEIYKRLRAFLGPEFDTLMTMDGRELATWMEANDGR